MHLVYRFRVKNISGQLNRWARVVNFVWNYCNDAQKHAAKWQQKWPTAFDLINATSGTSAELGIGSETIGAICQQYVLSRKQRAKHKLRYRGRKSLGWVPIKGRSIKREGDAFRFFGQTLRVFNPREFTGRICDGSSLSQDAKGNWYLNIAVKVAEGAKREAVRAVGIDLGLKDFAALSTGEKIENPRHYSGLEQRLAKAQRANHKRQALNIHAKIANRRRDMLHKLSNRLTKEFDYIAVGNISAKALGRSSAAKGVYDVSWSSFRNMLRYKSIRNGAAYEEVSEYLSTQACSACGCVSGPKGRAGLNERMWTCTDCGCEHDRDLNSAVNLLLRSGHRAPVQGIAA